MGTKAIRDKGLTSYDYAKLKRLSKEKKELKKSIKDSRGANKYQTVRLYEIIKEMNAITIRKKATISLPNINKNTEDDYDFGSFDFF